MAPAPASVTTDASSAEPTEGSLPTLVAAAFDALDRSGVAWALLRGEDDLATRGADIDLLVEAAGRDAAVGALAAAGFVELAARGRGSHRFLFGYDPAEDRWVKLDLVIELAFGRYAELATDLAPGCLARREADRRPVRLAADDASWTTLLHVLLDRPRLRPGDPPTIARAAADAAPEGPIAVALRAILPAGWRPERVVEVARGADEAGLSRLRRSLRSGLVRSDPARFARRLALGWAGRAAARLPGFGRGAGLSVAILGPDGAGKSTIAGGLVGAFPVPGRRVYLGLYGRGADGGERGPSSRFGLAGRLAWLWRRSLAARWQQLRGRLVVFDRHVLDESLAERAGGRRSRLRRWLLVHACPTPDLTVILDVPGEELFRRKGEHDPAFLERQRVHYRALAGRLRGGSVVDATADPETVRRRVVALVWAAYGRRAAGAHGG